MLLLNTFVISRDFHRQTYVKDTKDVGRLPFIVVNILTTTATSIWCRTVFLSHFALVASKASKEPLLHCTPFINSSGVEKQELFCWFYVLVDEYVTLRQMCASRCFCESIIYGYIGIDLRHRFSSTCKV